MCTSAGSGLTPEQAATLGSVLGSATSLDNPIFTLLFARLLEVLGCFMRGEAAAAGDLLSRYGFRSFEPQLAAAGLQLKRVLDLNTAVHGELYSRLIREEAAALSAPVEGGKKA